MLTRDPSIQAAPSRVVILGATGFIGRYLVDRLASAGIKTLTISSKAIDLSQTGAATRLVDLLRPSDSLVMLSSIAHRKKVDTDAFTKNMAMADTVCRALARAPCAHVIYMSSDSVYPFGDAPITEASPAAPSYLYGAMHAAREMMFRQAVPAGLLILRLTQIYGAGDTHNAYGPCRMLRSALADGRIVMFGAGEETRDHLLIDDMMAVLLRILERRTTGVLNLAGGQSTSFADLARTVAAQFNRPIDMVSVPRLLPGITHRHFDIRALRAIVPDFQPTKLSDGLKLTLSQLEAPANPAAAVS
jgi:UDP-glucose 4-epimerase